MDAAGTLNTAPSVSSQYFVSSPSYFFCIGDVGIQSIQVGSLYKPSRYFGETLYGTRVPVSFTSARFVRPARKRLARQFLVAPSESYLPGRGADFEQVLVSTVSRWAPWLGKFACVY